MTTFNRVMAGIAAALFATSATLGWLIYQGFNG